jgi:hypothetical protein
MGNNHDQFTQLKKLITSMTTKKLKENVSTPNYISALPLQDQIVCLDSFMELDLLVPSTLSTI